MKTVQYRINNKSFRIYFDDACNCITSDLKRYLPNYQADVQVRLYRMNDQNWDVIVSYDVLTNEELEAIRAGGPYEQTNWSTGEWETIQPEPEEA